MKTKDGRLSGVFCWPQGQAIENTPAQPYSKFSKSMGVMGVIGVMGQEKSYAQRHSKFFKMWICPFRPLRPSSPSKPENTPAQQDSKFSNGRLSGVSCWTQELDIENRPVEPYSKTSRLWRLAKNTSPQPHSIITKLENRPLSPSRLFSLSAPQNTSAQPHSKMTKFRKNQTLHFLHELHGEEMYSAQQDSRMSKSEKIKDKRKKIKA